VRLAFFLATSNGLHDLLIRSLCRYNSHTTWELTLLVTNKILGRMFRGLKTLTLASGISLVEKMKSTSLAKECLIALMWVYFFFFFFFEKKVKLSLMNQRYIITKLVHINNHHKGVHPNKSPKDSNSNKQLLSKKSSQTEWCHRANIELL